MVFLPSLCSVVKDNKFNNINGAFAVLGVVGEESVEFVVG
jgi:hypothetical protein